MAHFAKIDENNTVTQVIVVNNLVLLDESGNENELLGKEFCTQLLGGRWVQTSYSGKFRKNFAGCGYLYDVDKDAFVPPKPFNSWTLNEEAGQWEAPIPYPTDGKYYVWDETLLNWREVPMP